MMDDWPVIYSYTRAQAIEDGVLVDVSAEAAETGFRVPVALTRHLWEEAVAWEGDAEQAERGRLHDVLWMTYLAVRSSDRRGRGNRAECEVTVLRVPNLPGAHEALPVTFVAHSGPGDEGEHVVTLMFPEDD